ncbi:disease resistance protein Pik-1 [Eucalyptus grandis]|uniref:Uncharacterized protein n=3 Tax=Eucalyptus TaxID=3932 RepID=A0ACC3ITD6_EUCGR|nr:disease resistance protein Pik-1 [Eucalyptus grandis]KAK3405122.1 hypothetical protein EUGRSUZ_K01375 [Eucalyptus grandis]
MKQKVVIKVSMNGNGHASSFFCFGPQSPHSRALRLASGFRGVQSVALVGDRDQIEVTGEVDSVDLTNSLRKKFGSAEIVTVGEVKKEDKSEDKSEETEDVKPFVWPYPRYEYVYVQPGCWW